MNDIDSVKYLSTLILYKTIGTNQHVGDQHEHTDRSRPGRHGIGPHILRHPVLI